MKTPAIVVATIALAIGTGYVVAQTTPAPTTPPTGAPPSTMPRTTPPTTIPNDMPKTPQANTPTSMRPGTPTSPMAPDFATIDHKGLGYVTTQDAAGNAWLKQNFTTCDADKNGQVSRAEYTTCTTRP